MLDVLKNLNNLKNVYRSHNNGSKKNELSNSKDDEHPVQIIRLPRGPDGTKGFKHRRS